MRTIYRPKGPAAEYALYAVNFYNGCSNSCEYCYLKRGVLGKTLGGSTPTLQRKLKETRELYWAAAVTAANLDIPITMLTKRAEAAEWIIGNSSTLTRWGKKLMTIGFTLTGHDELEAGASTNSERIEVMRILHTEGFRTWASIEPIIDTESSLGVMRLSAPFCDYFKVGLRSGVSRVYYDDKMLRYMLQAMQIFSTPIYLKDSLIKRLGLDRTALDFPFINSDYDKLK